ncbi:hypothetical protein GPECTOR_38g328 [Gonium pectorale]|uniref:Uncharacterized protein n=1 Tax=Gonium pectorale TaxID=33097 RepID=A0A150GB66_GONPE|nr:hypothetical protein GPECTOR_38g328 [Gonium pectorale]|eukprot:KXZ47091.1 hypothetical protein GPECTOR_38g328 [Gonium pectorale]
MDRPPLPGLWKPYPCAARPVGGSDDGGAEELRRVSSALLGAAKGPVFLSLTSNTSLASGSGYWDLPTLGEAGRLVLCGPPGAATTLDLAGREDAWVWEPPPTTANPTFAYLYDLTLVNLPYSSHPDSLAGLMALAALSFAVSCSIQVPSVSAAEAGAGWLVVERLELQPAVMLLNCTLLSASAYATLPGAVSLLPQSRVWPPLLLLHGNRTRALAQGPQ